MANFEQNLTNKNFEKAMIFEKLKFHVTRVTRHCHQITGTWKGTGRQFRERVFREKKLFKNGDFEILT